MRIGTSHERTTKFYSKKLHNERISPCELVKNSFFGESSGRFFVRPSMSLRILLEQERSLTMNVAGQHRKGNITLESFDAMIEAYIQTVNLKCINC